MKIRFIPILLFSFLVSPLYAASFDCNKATTETEKAICAEPELSALDKDLGFIFKSLLKISDDKAALKVEQRQWLQSRDAYGDNFGGLYTSMAMRLNIWLIILIFLRCFQARYEIDLKNLLHGFLNNINCSDSCEINSNRGWFDDGC